MLNDVLDPGALIVDDLSLNPDPSILNKETNYDVLKKKDLRNM